MGENDSVDFIQVCFNLSSNASVRRENYVFEIRIKVLG